jgi:hypothetical protein
MNTIRNFVASIDAEKTRMVLVALTIVLFILAAGAPGGVGGIGG